MDLVKAGRYKAIVVEHGITETKNKDLQAAIRFGFETEAGYRELVWFGSFKKLALEHTLKALIVCGLQGNNPSGALEIGKEVSITVEKKPKDEFGLERNVVSWVNRLGGVGTKVEGATAAAKLEQYAGAIMALKEKTGGSNSGSGDNLGF